MVAVAKEETRVFEKYLTVSVNEEGEMGRIPKSLTWLVVGSCPQCQRREGGNKGQAGLRDKIPSCITAHHKTQFPL